MPIITIHDETTLKFPHRRKKKMSSHCGRAWETVSRWHKAICGGIWCHMACLLLKPLEKHVHAKQLDGRSFIHACTTVFAMQASALFRGCCDAYASGAYGSCLLRTAFGTPPKQIPKETGTLDAAKQWIFQVTCGIDDTISKIT